MREPVGPLCVGPTASFKVPPNNTGRLRVILLIIIIVKKSSEPVMKCGFLRIMRARQLGLRTHAANMLVKC